MARLLVSQAGTSLVGMPPTGMGSTTTMFVSGRAPRAESRFGNALETATELLLGNISRTGVSQKYTRIGHQHVVAGSYGSWRSMER